MWPVSMSCAEAKPPTPVQAAANVSTSTVTASRPGLGANWRRKQCFDVNKAAAIGCVRRTLGGRNQHPHACSPPWAALTARGARCTRTTTPLPALSASRYTCAWIGKGCFFLLPGRAGLAGGFPPAAERVSVAAADQPGPSGLLSHARLIFITSFPPWILAGMRSRHACHTRCRSTRGFKNGASQARGTSTRATKRCAHRW